LSATATEQTIRCDNVVWDRSRKEHVRCNAIVARQVEGAKEHGTIEVVCRRCGARHWLPKG
jgi:hypothetical protein